MPTKSLSTRLYIAHKTVPLSQKQRQTLVLDSVFFLRYLADDLKIISPFYQDFSTFFEELKNEEVALNHRHFYFLSSAGEFHLRLEQDQVALDFFVEAPIFFKKQKVIFNFSDELQKAVGLYGFLRPEREFLENNVEEVALRTFNTPEEIAALPKRKDLNGEVLIDCQQFFGCNLYYEELLFTSCWVMYISKDYEKVLPLEIFLEAQQVESLDYFQNSPRKTIKTQLFKDPFLERNPANLNFQKLYAEQLGINQLSLENGVGLLREPRVEYLKTGDLLQCVQYRNDNFQPEKKSKATLFITRTINLQTGLKKVQYLKGVLNARAYFPWVDEERGRMLSYRVLNPERTCDDGLGAYEYFIRQLLEIQLLDENFKNYERVLMLFIPPESLKDLPIEALLAKFPECKVKKRRFSRDLTLNFAKEHQSLTVTFVSYERLELPHKEQLLAQIR